MNPPPPPPPLPTTTTLLPEALSTLTSLLNLTSTALHSLQITTTTPILLPCPFNPTHQIPPQSLFAHHLRCPSPISLPHALNYPHTLHAPPSSFVTQFTATSSDLFISLEDYAPAKSLFYQNTPCAVVLINNDPSVSPPPTLTIPRVLYLECQNVNKEIEKSNFDFSLNSIRVLPSEIFVVQNEIERWRGDNFPTSYSFRVLRAIVRLNKCVLSRASDWVVVNSRNYGVVIDFPMRDHMILLVKLCLKAITKEAFELFSDVGLKGLMNRKMECPVLMDVLNWLASQFSVLYGEVNGKFFAADVLKECLLESSLNSSLFPLEDKESGLESSSWMDNWERNEREGLEGQSVGNSVIFISQVAAAVAALHERAMVEGVIRSLRDSPPLSAYQRNMEHAYVSKIAEEERQKRPDYKPIIEHDGFLWQKSRNQGTNKPKTKEELLAEERDYKRGRMSYRGKKLKRNTTEVMRDIIAEYMEEIKQSEGISSISNTSEKAVTKSYTHEIGPGISKSKRKSTEIFEETESRARANSKQSLSRYNSEDFEYDSQIREQESKYYNELEAFDKNAKKVEIIGVSSSRKSHQSRKMSREPNSHKMERDEESRECRDRGRSKHSHKSERDEESRGYNRDKKRSKTNRDYIERDDKNGRQTSTHRSNREGSNSSRYDLHNEFDDRYDPEMS